MRLRPSTSSLPAVAYPPTAVVGRSALHILKGLGLSNPGAETDGEAEAVPAKFENPDDPNTAEVITFTSETRQASSAASLRLHASSPFAVQMREIVTGLSTHPREDAARAVVVAGIGVSTDPTVVSASLAVMCAINGFRTALVDANLGRPRLQSLFGTANDVGLTDLLLENYPAQSLLQPSAIPNLAFMLTGHGVDDHASLLLRESVLHRLEPLASAFDFVITDCATLSPQLVARIAEGATDVIVVVKRHAASMHSLEEMLDVLRQDGNDNASVLIVE